MVASKQPHAVLIPYPAQGHVTPMLKVAMLLHSKGFYITFVNTEYNHGRLVKSRGPEAVEGLPDFRFETIPDGLPPSDVDGTQDIPALCDAIMTDKLLPPFRELLGRLGGVPPLTCIVSDGCMSFTLDAAEELGVPEVMFWTPSACGVLAYLYYKDLVAKGITPFKNVEDLSNGYLDTAIDFLPGLNNIRLRDFPSFIRTTDPNDVMLNFVIRETERTSRASAIIINTFDDLERPVLEAMAPLLPPIYTIGPLHFLTDTLLPPESPTRSLSSSLWKEDTACLDWLDGKESNSVVYVNFGSITVMTSQQLVEFAWGLANTGLDFLWVIRSDLVRGHDAVLPEDLLAETKERGMLASWCPQEAVLSHRAIGGFLTHSGWNSTLESIGAGVPMVCWPFFAEQQTNCRYACAEWGIGMEIDNNVRREEVEELIRELMGAGGEKMRAMALEWKERAMEATRSDGGSSYRNLDKLIHEVLLPKN